ncbi:MAG: hypothetical protein IKO64_05200 [Kiritimatiellae bacterium]|nr:hypothetical protein [Kiritimatiellia bacterium]MBR4523611.1 hypothetical protein [Kiritimatiellia bacterium]
MKCEICNRREAETTLKGETEDDEKYVCRECASAYGGADGADGEAGEEGEEPGFVKEHISGVIDAFDGLISEIKRTMGGAAEEPRRDMVEFPLGRLAPEFRLLRGLHLEGTSLLNELEPVRRALHAVDMDLECIQRADNGMESGHTYRILYAGSEAAARKVVQAVLDYESVARARLCDDRWLVLCDTVARSLAILRSARLLSAAEYLDLLSPLKLAACEGLLGGIKAGEIDALAQSLEFGYPHDADDLALDAIDAERAAGANARFARVTFKENSGGRR